MPISAGGEFQLRREEKKFTLSLELHNSKSTKILDINNT